MPTNIKLTLLLLAQKKGTNLSECAFLNIINSAKG